MNIDEIISGLRADNERRLASMRARIASVEARSGASREFTPLERSAQDADDAAVTSNNERISELQAQQSRDVAHSQSVRDLGIGGTGSNGAVGGYDRQTRVLRESGPYRPDGRHSFFKDLYSAQKGDFDAAQRMRENSQHREAYAPAGTVQQRAISTVNGAGGEWVPPAWLETEFVALARPARVTADLFNVQDLPPGTDVLNIPKVATGAAVGGQTSQNTAIQQTDITTTSLSSNVYTVAGGQTISLQLFDQSPLAIDKIILADLAHAYAGFIDTYAIAGTGSNMPRGALNVSGVIAVTFTGAAVTGAGSLYSCIANAVQQVQTTRFLPPDSIVMHPRRFNALSAAVDTAGRPLILPVSTQGGSYNAMGQSLDGVPAQGAAGFMFGLPVYVDPNIPTNRGTNTNQDCIIVGRFADLFLWEGQLRAQAFEQTYAAQMSLFLRLYNYVSIQAARYPASIAVIDGLAASTAGNGLTAPTF